MNGLQVINDKRFQIFSKENLGSVRTVFLDNEVWFCAKDVCSILEIKNTTQAVQRLDEDERSMFNIGRQGNVNFINESGLYTLILRSDKKEAKPFRKWITSEVIPVIRKTGMYATDELLNNPDLAIKAFTKLKEEKEKRMLLEKQIEEQASDVAFAKSLTVSKDCILVREMAKLLKQNGIDTGEERLFIYFRTNGYLISKKGSDWNMPTQKSMNLGLFVIKEGTRQSASEGVKITKTPKVTPKGQKYFLNKFTGNAKILVAN